jgi:hypothetical protein
MLGKHFCATKFERKVSKYEKITNELSHRAVTGTVLYNEMLMTFKHNLTKLRMLRQHSLQMKQLFGKHYQTPTKT